MVAFREHAAMPTTADLELPIKAETYSGPGVEAHNNRKEHNNNVRATAEALRASYEKVKDSIFDGLRTLSR